MTETAAPLALPRTGAVFAEQIRTVGLGVRREALVLGAALFGLGLLLLIDQLDGGGPLNGLPIPPVAMIALGALSPFAVWKGERVFGGSHLWTLPVERRLHALLKVAAGALWLLLAVAVIQLWMLGMTVVTGGDIVASETRMLVGPGGAELRTVRWTTQPWEWVTPFTTALTCYLIGSAFMLGAKYPLRWGIGAVAAFVSLGLLSETGVAGGLAEALFEAVTESRVGMGPALGQGIADEVDGAPPVPGSDASVLVHWYRLPSFERWAPAVAFWLALSAALVWAASSRHREH